MVLFGLVFVWMGLFVGVDCPSQTTTSYGTTYNTRCLRGLALSADSATRTTATRVRAPGESVVTPRMRIKRAVGALAVLALIFALLGAGNPWIQIVVDLALIAVGLGLVVYAFKHTPTFKSAH
jgi:hypothetical protein